jgi:hypothetical protein
VVKIATFAKPETVRSHLEEMTEKDKHIKTQIDYLRSELEKLIAFFENRFDSNKMVYEYWNAKDILGHITFWHESFARNISDLGKGIKPSPLTGKLSEVNKQSVETTKNDSIENLILDRINLRPYKKGSRDYSRSEHLEVVSNHIHKHLKDISKIYATTK